VDSSQSEQKKPRWRQGRKTVTASSQQQPAASPPTPSHAAGLVGSRRRVIERFRPSQPASQLASSQPANQPGRRTPQPASDPQPNHSCSLRPLTAHHLQPPQHPSSPPPHPSSPLQNGLPSRPPLAPERRPPRRRSPRHRPVVRIRLAVAPSSQLVKKTAIKSHQQ
jgi:hypothetical protein